MAVDPHIAGLLELIAGSGYPPMHAGTPQDGPDLDTHDQVCRRLCRDARTSSPAAEAAVAETVEPFAELLHR